MRVVTKDEPRKKGMVPSTKWKIAFGISLIINLIEIVIIFYKW